MRNRTSPDPGTDAADRAHRAPIGRSRIWESLEDWIMSLLFTQDWDVIRGKEDEYAEFVTNVFIPNCNKLGLQSVGGFYVQVGVGPKIAIFLFDVT